MPPFLFIGESYGDAGMGVARLLGVCATFLFASSVAASTIDVGPSNWRNYGPSASHTAQGVSSSFGQNVRLPPTISGPTRVLPVSRNPVIPYGSIANGLRNFTRINPASIAASAAVTGLFLAVDWVFDQELGEWAIYSEGELEDPDYSLWTATSSDDLTFTGPSAESVCTQSLESYGREFGGLIYESDTRQICVAEGRGNYWTATRIAECPEGSTYHPQGGYCALEGEYIPVGESEWGELAASLPSRSPQQVANAASDTQVKIGGPLPGYTDLSMSGPSSVTGPETTSTSTDPVTGDTTVTTTSTQTDISYAPTSITTTNTTTTTTYQNGQETSTTVTTETPGELPVSSGGGASGDWPGFCEWASVVCDWFNWTQEDPPPEQDLPSVIDDDFYQEKTISFGAKSCPPDHQIDLTPFLATSVAVSFQPLCDFAGLIYYMVMAASYIIAAYITIGVARNG